MTAHGQAGGRGWEKENPIERFPLLRRLPENGEAALDDALFGRFWKPKKEPEALSLRLYGDALVVVRLLALIVLCVRPIRNGTLDAGPSERIGIRDLRHDDSGVLRASQHDLAGIVDAHTQWQPSP
jgi:hypothetical protein